MQAQDSNYFVIQRSQLDISKLFVEFYLPKYQILFEKLRQGKYPLLPLRQLSKRLFDGPFGSNRKVEMYQESGIPYIRVKDVMPDGINLSKLTYISEKKHKELTRSRVLPGNLLITIAGRIGTVAVFPDSLEEGNITGHIAGIELTENINPHYLTTFLNSPLGEFQFTILGHRTTRPELNLSEVKQILVSVPPRPIQDRIAQVMQNAYTARQEKLVEAEKVELSVNNCVLECLGIKYSDIKNIKHFTIPITELISSRFDVQYQSPKAKYALSLLKDSDYDVRPLGELIIQICYGVSVKNNYSESGIPFLRIGNLKPNYIDTSDIVYFDINKRNDLGKAFVKTNDLLMSRSGSVGTVAVVQPEVDGFAFGSYQIKFCLRDGFANPYFIAYFLNSPLGNAQVEQQKTGSIQMNITIEGIKALKVPLPAVEIQNEIVQEADRQRTKAKRLRTEAETLVAKAKARVEQMILGEEDEA